MDAIPPAISILSTALDKSFQDQAEAAEKIADPRRVGDLEAVQDFIVAENQTRITIAAMRSVNETTGTLIDLFA